MLWTIFAIVASIITAFQLIPQTIQTVKSKELSGVSLLSFGTITITACMWLIYGIHLKDFAIIFANLIALICALTIVSTKLKRG